MTDGESDVCLLGVCVLLGIDPVAIQEKAGMLEYDCGMTRDEANRAALTLLLKARDRRFSERFVSVIFQAAGPVVEARIRNGWTRARTAKVFLNEVNRLLERMPSSSAAENRKAG